MRALHAMSPPEHKGFIAGLDARLKLTALVCAAMLSVLLDSPWALLSLLCLSLLPPLASKLGWGRWRLLLFMVLTLTWGTMLSQAIFYYNEPRTVLLNLVSGDTPFLGPLLGEVSLYLEGFEHGAVQSLRISTMLILGLTLCWTTDNASMLRGLLAFRLPFVVSFMSVTAVRFLPIIMQEFAQVALAWRLRGGKLVSLNPVAMLLAWLKITGPVLVNCYRRSATLSLSIQTRAFTPQSAQRRAAAGWSRGQRLAASGLVLFTLAAMVAKGLYWLYVAGLYYHSGLRPLYGFCRLYF